MHSKRGIVVSTPMDARSGQLEITTGPLDPQELRFWLLFWDKLNFPLLEGFHIGAGRDAEYLEQIGLLERCRVSDVRICINSSPEQNLPEEQLGFQFMRAFRELDAAEPGSWSVATGERSIALDPDFQNEGRGVLVRLHRALPVPNADVPLDDILQFKERRRDELGRLRVHFERTCDRIRSSPDGPMAINTELTALDLSLRDFLKTAKEGLIKRWVNTSIEMSVPLAPGVNSAVSAYALGLPVLQSIATGVAAQLSVSGSFGLKGLTRNNGVPWQYVANYLDKVF